MILFDNGCSLGAVAGLFLQRGEFWSVFVTYVAPHGLLERHLFAAGRAHSGEYVDANLADRSHGSNTPAPY